MNRPDRNGRRRRLARLGSRSSHELPAAGVPTSCWSAAGSGRRGAAAGTASASSRRTGSVQLPDITTTATIPTASCRATSIVGYLERYARRLRRSGARGRGRDRAPPRARRRAPARDLGWRDRGAGASSSPRARTRSPTGRGAPRRSRRDLLQIDVEGYRNPSELPDGAVLVVGSGQSGCQISEELHLAGRDVFLACGRAGWAPRRITDHDTVWWLREAGDSRRPRREPAGAGCAAVGERAGDRARRRPRPALPRPSTRWA